MQWLDQQRLFKQAIEGNSTEATDLFRNKKNLPATQGLKIYQDAYSIRTREFLEDDYPTSQKILGRSFSKMCREYALKHPSVSPTATDFGRHFAEFLSAQKFSKEKQCLPELAQFEWLLNEVLFAPEPEVAGLEKIISATESDWLGARLIFDPSLRLLETAFPVDSIYEEESTFGPEPCFFVIWREDKEACYRRIEQAEHDMLQILSRDVSLKALAAKENGAGELDPDLFSLWLSSGLLRGISWS